jgi:bla regulator protein BlaR1
MMVKTLSDFATEAGPAMANHLWQSTVFAAVVGVVTLVLRKNHARVRYGLWLAASVKFLIPFSLLVSLGHLAAPHRAVGADAGLYSVVEEVGQPFVQPLARVVPGHASYVLSLMPEVLAGVWIGGFFALLGLWGVRWWRISAAKQRAMPMTEGREVDALRELELIAGMRKPISLLLCGSSSVPRRSLEPGIFGIVRTVLLWPAGISEHMNDAHLKAILAHEVMHVRRRDNLAAAVHMLVESAFWFHPLVWWLGARLIEERERACDEGVLALGSEPEIYAESILKACEFCVESPLPCVSGVTGSNLKKRIVRIMTQRIADKLTLGRKVLLATIGMAAVAGPVVIGLVDAPRVDAKSAQATGAPVADFEVTNFKANHTGDQLSRMGFAFGGFIDTNATVKSLIEFAYNVKDYQISGGPSWIDSERFDLEVKEKGSPVADEGKPGPMPIGQMDQIRATVRSLLADRFNLKVSQQTKVVPTYALVVGDSGPKLIEAPEPVALPLDKGSGGPRGQVLHVQVLNGPGSHGQGFGQGFGQGTGEPVMNVRVLVKNGLITVTGPVGTLAEALSAPLGHQVVDQTGLKGNYDMTLRWTPGEGEVDSVSAAIQEQLGLKIEPEQSPVQAVVIDQIEKPSA